MDTETRDLRTGLEKWARSYEPRLLDGPAAARELRRVARMKAICASVETRLARRVEETNAWQRGGYRSAAHLVARETGTSIHQAVMTLQTGAHLEELPAVRDAFTCGRVTQAQVSEIAPAASSSPRHEAQLIAVAEDGRNQATLRDTCRRVKADATNQLERRNQVHSQRSARTWTEREARGISMPTAPRTRVPASWPGSIPRPKRCSLKRASTGRPMSGKPSMPTGSTPSSGSPSAQAVTSPPRHRHTSS